MEEGRKTREFSEPIINELYPKTELESSERSE
jgi:hypothetical protein